MCFVIIVLVSYLNYILLNIKRSINIQLPFTGNHDVQSVNEQMTSDYKMFDIPKNNFETFKEHL